MSHSEKNSSDQLENTVDLAEKQQQALDDEALDKEAMDDVRDDKVGKTNQESSDEVTIDELRQQLEAVQAKADENWDTVLRLRAEAENQRRRSEKHVEDAHKFAIKRFVEELLPVADSLEMGMAAEGDIEQIREGMNLTMKVLESALEKFAVEAINPLGEKFNPDLHQAMAMQPSDEYEDGYVSAVMQKGYTLNGRLVRPAMVVVVKN